MVGVQVPVVSFEPQQPKPELLKFEVVKLGDEVVWVLPAEGVSVPEVCVVPVFGVQALPPLKPLKPLKPGNEFHGVLFEPLVQPVVPPWYPGVHPNGVGRFHAVFQPDELVKPLPPQQSLLSVPGQLLQVVNGDQAENVGWYMRDFAP